MGFVGFGLQVGAGYIAPIITPYKWYIGTYLFLKLREYFFSKKYDKTGLVGLCVMQLALARRSECHRRSTLLLGFVRRHTQRAHAISCAWFNVFVRSLPGCGNTPR